MKYINRYELESDNIVLHGSDWADNPAHLHGEAMGENLADEFSMEKTEFYKEFQILMVNIVSECDPHTWGSFAIEWAEIARFGGEWESNTIFKTRKRKEIVLGIGKSGITSYPTGCEECYYAFEFKFFEGKNGNPNRMVWDFGRIAIL